MSQSFISQDAAEEGRRQARSRAWARFFGRRWDVALTMTHSTNPSPGLVLRATHRWAQTLEQRRGAVPYVAVVERAPFPHVHAFVGGVGSTRYVTPFLKSLWHYGDVQVIRAPGRHHVRYVAEKMDEAEILMPDNLPTRQRRTRRMRRKGLQHLHVPSPHPGAPGDAGGSALNVR